MFCPSCGQSNTENALNCISCGRPLPQAAASPDHILGIANAPSAPPPRRGESDGGQPPDRIYAAFWYRFLALFIDGIIVGVVIYALILIFFLVGIGFSLTDLTDLEKNDNLSAPVMIGMIFMVYIMPFFVSMLYYSLMESSSKQATLGKMAVGIKVTDEHGGRISRGRAFGRFFAHIITHFTLLIGFIICVFTKRQQTVHDLIAGTLVVYKDVTPQDLEKYPSVRAETVQKVTAVGALAMIYLFYIGIIAAAIYFAVSGAKLNEDDYSFSYSDVEINALAAKLTGYDAIDAADDYYQENGKFPKTLEEAGFVLDSELVHRVWIDRNNGEITLQLSFSPLEGKHLIFYPEKDADDDWEWFCFSHDIEDEYLPEDCEYIPKKQVPKFPDAPGSAV